MEGGIAAAAARMGPGAQHGGGHDRAHARPAEQLRPPGPHQDGNGPGVVGDLGVQELDAAGQGAQAGHGGRGLRIPVSPLAQPPAGADQTGRGQASKPSTEGIGSGEHERSRLALGVAGGLDRGAAGGQPHLERCARSGGSRLGELVTAQRLAGCSGGIQGVGLGAVAASDPLGPVQLHHLLGVGLQEPGQAGAVAAGALDRPDPPTIPLVGQLQQLLAAGRGRGHRCLGHHCPGGGGHDRGGAGLFVGVDPDGLARRGLPAWPCVDSLPGG
jgi:hypothetical protein